MTAMDARVQEPKTASTRIFWTVVGCLLLGALTNGEEPIVSQAKGHSQSASDSGTRQKTSNSDLPLSRSFHLGFTPDDLLNSPEVSKTVFETLSKHADLVAFHIGLGVPWEEALKEQPFPPAVEGYLAKLLKMKGQLRGRHAVYLALTPLNLTRRTIAAYWGGDAAGAKKWRSRSLDDPDTILAYTRFCLRLIRTFKPDYFSYGVEVNMLADASPREFEQYQVLAKQVYKTLKAENPKLPIFLTFQIDLYHKHRARQRPVITQLLPYSDFIAVSTYPYTVVSTKDRTTTDRVHRIEKQRLLVGTCQVVTNPTGPDTGDA
jgi:hypothetical protein